MEPRKDSAAKTISVVMAITLIGKALGLYRDRLLAIHYSTGMAANAFFTASRIPRVFFDAVFAAAIASCFIPVYSEYLEKKGKKEAAAFACAFITAVALLTAALSGLGMLFPQPLVALFADYADPQTTALAVSLTRVLFPMVFFSGVAFSLVGVLQAHDRFTAPALMSAAANIVIIGYFFFLDDSLGIYGLAGAYLAGWLLQMLVQLPSLGRLGFRYRPRLDLRADGLKKVFALMGPVMVSTWVQPINLVVNSRFGSRLYEGAGVSAMEYSTNLYLVIAGTFILSITNVIFPKLSRLTAGGKEDSFRDTLRTTLRFSLFLVLPMSAGLTALAKPLISFIYGGGSFGEFSIGITSTALAWVSLGMAGYAVQNILSRAYFAKQEGRAPLLAGAVSIGVNIALCILLTAPLGVAGLAVSSAASSTVYALLLLIPMCRADRGLLNGAFARDLAKMALAALVMGRCVAWLLPAVSGALAAGKAAELAVLGVCALTGVLLYFILTLLLGVDEAKTCLAPLRGLRKRG